MTFYAIRAAATDDNADGEAAPRHADLMIYDEIGASWWGDTTDAKTFVKDLAELDVDTISLRLNSPGGSVFDGVAIYNALKLHPAAVTTYVDGLAASIASIVALAGERVVMREGAYLMIHNPWSWAIGDAAEMRKTADLLDQLRDTTAAIYARRIGDRASIEDVHLLMAEETWFDGAQALAIGLADEVDDETEAVAVARFDGPRALARFQHAPDRVAAALRAPRPAQKDPAPDETDAAGMVSTTTNTKVDARAFDRMFG